MVTYLKDMLFKESSLLLSPFLALVEHKGWWEGNDDYKSIAPEMTGVVATEGPD